MMNFLPSNSSKAGAIVAVLWCLVWLGLYGYGLYSVHDMRFGEEIMSADETAEAEYARLLQYYNKAKIHEAEIDSRFAKVGEDVKTLEEIENFAEQKLSGFEITNINPDNTDFPTLNLGVKGKGSWREAVKFLESMQSMPYVSEVNKYTLSREMNTGTSSQPIWNLEMDIKVPLIPGK